MGNLKYPVIKLIVFTRTESDHLKGVLLYKRRNMNSLDELVKGSEKITRLEVIEEGNGRVYVASDTGNKLQVLLQDDGRTLKVFISKK